MAGPARRYAFGAFALDVRTGELRAGGRRVPLTRQSFLLLRLLVEHPGDVVSRDDARRVLWPDGTHVDYDHGLNNAAARLRRALGDASAMPRFVETLPRVGYRFLLPVRVMEASCSDPHGDEPRGSAAWAGRALSVLAGAACLFVAGLSVGLVWTARSNGGSVLPAPASAEAVDQAERSLAYTRLVLGGDLAADIAYEPATDAAARALALDPTLADAHVAAGYAAMWGRWDWASADRLFRAAIDGHPYSARAHQAHALWLSARGRHAEALAAIDTSRRLDRTSIDVARDAARLAFLAGRVDTAVSRLQALLVERPDDAPAHELLSLALSSRGENRVAAGHFERYLVLIGIDPRYATVDAQVLAESGFRGLTRWHLSRPSTKPADRYGVPFKLASSHALVGNHEAALHWLERARHQRDSRLLFVNVDPRFAGLRDDPRFRRLIAEVGL